MPRPRPDRRRGLYLYGDKMKCKLLIISVLVVLLAACSTPRKLTVEGPVEWRVETPSKLVVVGTVRNCSAHGVRVTDARLRLHYVAGDYVTVLLGEPFHIARCAATAVEFPLRVRFADPLAMLTAAAMESLPVEKLFVTGEVAVRIGCVRKKIRVENTPLSQFLNNLAGPGVASVQ